MASASGKSGTAGPAAASTASWSATASRWKLKGRPEASTSSREWSAASTSRVLSPRRVKAHSVSNDGGVRAQSSDKGEAKWNAIVMRSEERGVGKEGVSQVKTGGE